mgnify:CR=1 FL=1
MDILYHVNRQEDDINSTKINIDELYEKKQQHDMFTLGSYNKILARIHTKIRFTSKQYIENNFCWYVIPEVLLGIPKYDHRECIAYVIDKLQENNFIVRYIHPNLLFISWNHWVPSYVRNEIKKKTGIVLDGNGNRLNNAENTNSTNNILKTDNNSIIFNVGKTDKNSRETKNNNNYKDINSYKPQGKLIYNTDLINKLSIDD